MTTDVKTRVFKNTPKVIRATICLTFKNDYKKREERVFKGIVSIPTTVKVAAFVPDPAQGRS